MPDFIPIRCPACDARIKAPTQLLGRMRNCPGCGQLLLVQNKAPQDAGPLLLDGEAVVPIEEKLILLVDDDRELNDGLRSLLEKSGYRVVQAFDGVQAKDVIHQQRPDLMILDMMMPRLGGYPVLEYLQTIAAPPPVIMITAKEGEQHKVYAEYLGVVEYLHKPFAIQRFLESVEKNLGRGSGEQTSDVGA
jgi:CheY-like chemotaxis protein